MNSTITRHRFMVNFLNLWFYVSLLSSDTLHDHGKLLLGRILIFSAKFARRDRRFGRILIGQRASCCVNSSLPLTCTNAPLVLTDLTISWQDWVYCPIIIGLPTMAASNRIMPRYWPKTHRQWQCPKRIPHAKFTHTICQITLWFWQVRHLGYDESPANFLESINLATSSNRSDDVAR